MAKIRVLLADDHAVLRAGLRLLINAQPDMEVVGEAASAREAADLVKELQPHVLTLDLNMPGGSSIPTIERLRREQPQVRALVLTMHDDAAYCRSALAAGCAGYVVKTAADTELITAIRAVHAGRSFVNIDLGAGRSLVDETPSTDKLSEREREVLQLLAEGHTNQAIADKLFLSVKTIETYRARIGEKLGLKSRADLVRFAVETGLLKPTQE